MSEDKEKFHLVLLPDDGAPVLKSFIMVESLAAFLRTQSPSTKGFLFHGVRVNVTEGPFRYLLHQDKEIPLFDPPKVGKIAKPGSLGEVSPPDDLDPDYKKALDLLPSPEDVTDEDEDVLPAN